MGRYINQSIILSDGRQLGFAEYGDLKGYPVIALHGTPGSRIWFETDDPISKKLGIRLITLDRPGYGLSDQMKNRTIIDFVNDVSELLNSLDIDRYSVLGVSGGGAYALALASQDQRIQRTALIASVYEINQASSNQKMNVPNRVAIFLSKYFPWLLRYSYRHQKRLLDTDPETYVRESRKRLQHLCPSDREISSKVETSRLMVLHLREAFRADANEAVREIRMLAEDWNIEFDKIKCRVDVWHGTDDTLSPLAGIKNMVRALPNKKEHYLDGKGHFLDEDELIWHKILSSIRGDDFLDRVI